MSQLIIDNAAAISLDRDLTVAQSVSASRRLQWFRKGPIQTIAEVQLNVLQRFNYQPILGSLSGNIIGPYTLQFPAEVVGSPVQEQVTVSVGGQGGNSITVTFATAREGNGGYTAGTILQFPNHTQTYVLTADAIVSGSGTASLALDQPLFVATTANDILRTGTDVMFSMNLINRPRASFGPGAHLVNHDGPFIYSEVV